MTVPPARDAIAPHVPPQLLRDDYPFVFGASTTENPFKTMVPKVHEGPDIIYSTRIRRGYRPAWVPRRMEDLRAIYLDTEHFSSKGFSALAAQIGESWNQVPAEIDPPMHATYRALMNPLLSPKRIQALEAKARQAARGFILKFRDRAECEFMSEFAFSFPVVVFLDLVDLPHDRMEEFLRWERMLLHSTDLGSVVEATRRVVDYLREVIEERRSNPGDDFISFAVTAQIDGRALTDDELMGFCFNLYIGGLDTVSTNIGLQFRHLAETPRDQERLRSDPAFIPIALEELCRAYSAVTTYRTCVKAVEVNGVTFMPGDMVAMSTTLGNRDPAAFDRPNEIILDRSPAHMTFGHGIHRCIGSHLARREMQIALEEFLALVPDFRIREGAQIVSDLASMIQPRTLPLVWNA